MELGKDILKALGIGAVLGAACFILFFAGGFLSGGISVHAGFAAARSGMFIVGALGLFLLAGTMLYKRGEHELKHAKEWKRRFRVCSYRAVIGIVSAELLVIASVIDYFLYYR